MAWPSRFHRGAGLCAALLALLPALAFAATPTMPDAPLLESLRGRVRHDRHDLQARLSLADLLGESPDIECRREAARALEEALHLTSGDAGIWARMARLQERRGFRREAERAFHRAVGLAPDRADLWGDLAQHELEWFQQSLNPEHRRRAEAANDRALALDPGLATSFRRAVKLAAYRGDDAAMADLARRWKEAAPLDPEPFLVEGMLYADAGAWSEAQDAFTRGIAGLGQEERPVFDSLRLVAPRFWAGLEAAPDSARQQRDFWRWRDPTPADEMNPGWLEYCRRLVRADLLFGIDRMHVRGWDHAPGEMLVRYGLPAGWRFDRDVDRFGEYHGFAGLHTNLFRFPSIEVAYGDGNVPLSFVFLDYSLNGRFYRPIEGFPRDEDFFLAQVPSHYASPSVAPDRDQETEVWRVMDDDGKEVVEVAAALKPGEWPEDLLQTPHRLASSVTVYDPEWRVIDTAVASWAPFERDPLGRLVALFRLRGGADSLIVGLETSDREEKARYAGYAELAPVRCGAAPCLGDLVFLSRVSFDGTGGPYARGSAMGLPNPGHRYRQGDPIGFAFQVRDLPVNEAGLHDTRIRVTVGRPTRRGWLDVLLKRGQSPAQAQLVFDHLEPGARLDQVLTVDVPDLEPGEYQLRVVVEDRIGGESREAAAPFRVVAVEGAP